MEKELKQDDHLILHHYTTESILGAPPCPELYALLLNKVFNNTTIHGIRYTKAQTSWLRQAQTGIMANIEIQCAWMLTNTHLKIRNEALKDMSKKHKEEDIPLLFENIAWLCHEFAKIVQKLYQIDSPQFLKKPPTEMQAEQVKHNTTYLEALRLKITWSHSIAIFELDGKLYSTPQPYVLMIHNKLADLMSVLTYSHSAAGVCFSPRAFQQTLDMVGEMVSLAVEYKDQFFTLIKSLEAFVTGEILIQIDDWDNSTFLRSVSKELEAKVGFKYIGST